MPAALAKRRPTPSVTNFLPCGNKSRVFTRGASISKKQRVIPSEARARLRHFVAEIGGAPSLRFGVTAN